jgi:hypothetical protein
MYSLCGYLHTSHASMKPMELRYNLRAPAEGRWNAMATCGDLDTRVAAGGVNGWCRRTTGRFRIPTRTTVCMSLVQSPRYLTHMRLSKGGDKLTCVTDFWRRIGFDRSFVHVGGTYLSPISLSAPNESLSNGRDCDFDDYFALGWFVRVHTQADEDLMQVPSRGWTSSRRRSN